MLVTYKALKEGYILRDNDTLNIYGCKYVVRDSREGCFLMDTRGVCRNDWLFLHIYGMSDEQKDAWAAEYGGKPGCFFPMMPTLQQLTEFVKKIYETCPFKVGDTVRIKKREYSACDYPASFVDTMAEQAGNTFVIKEIGTMRGCNPFTYKDEGGGDIHYYRLEGTPYNWTSNMFQLVERADGVPPRKELGLVNDLAIAMQGTPAMRVMPARGHSSHFPKIGEIRFVTPQQLAGALGEQGTTPVSELKKDKIPEGEDITVRPPKHYSTIFKI